MHISDDLSKQILTKNNPTKDTNVSTEISVHI